MMNSTNSENLTALIANTYFTGSYSQRTACLTLKPPFTAPDYFISGGGELADGVVVQDSISGEVNLLQKKNKRCVVKKLIQACHPAGMIYIPENQVFYLIDRSEKQISSLNCYSVCDGDFKLTKKLYKRKNGDLESIMGQDEGDDNYVEFNEIGKLSEGQIDNIDSSWQPKDITLSKHGQLVISDVSAGASNRLGCYDLNGRMVTQFGRAEGPGMQTFESPLHLCNDIFGRIIASDAKVGKVEVYDSRGFWVRTIGSRQGDYKADQPSTLLHPCGVASDHYGNIIVCDTQQSRIALFSNTGEFIENVVLRKNLMTKYFPQNIVLDSIEKNLIVTLFQKNSNNFEKIIFKKFK